jgi:hypothetical protein
MALLNNAFSGQSDTALTYTRRAVAEHIKDHDFPYAAINSELRRAGRTASIENGTIDAVLSLSYGKPLTFIALSLLNDDNRWRNVSYHQDHIFPQALFKTKHMNSVGLSPNRQKTYIELMHRIGNLELLLSSENQEKSSQDVEKWLSTRTTDFRERHLIPNEEDLLGFNRFEDFIAAREELFRQRLKTIFGLPETQSSVPSPSMLPNIQTDRQVFIHQLLHQLVDNSPELEKDGCDEEVVRFGIKDWDVPVLKAGKKWPSSGRILLFTWVNRDQQLYLELGLGWSPEDKDTREKLFQVALSNEPPFNPPHYQNLPPQWIYLYRRIFLKQPEYTNMGNDTLSVYISKQWINFLEKELPLLDSVLKAQQWIWG